jgi:hypothetical protein
LQQPLPKNALKIVALGEANEIKPQRHELTLGRTHETQDASFRREANHGAVRRVVGSVDDSDNLLDPQYFVAISRLE